VVDQDGDQQTGFTAGHVHRPGHLASVGEVEDVPHELQEVRLVVGHPARLQGLAVGVHSDAVVVGLTAVDPGPYPAHRAPEVVPALRTTDDLAGIALHSDLVALPNRRPSRRGEQGGQASGATNNSSQPESHTPLPWVPQPYEWLGCTRELKGRAA
jgi:hypothetical protein